MSINFPNSPAVNDIFTAGVIKYKWDGTKWYSITEGYLPLTGGTLTGALTVNDQTTAAQFNGPLNGNANTATALQTSRTINGTSFDGSANITTNSWGTSRTVTIGSTGKSVDGSANVTWSLSEIGAQAADADLTAIAALSGTSGLLKKTAADTWTLDTNTYITSYSETDPVYTASSWYTTTNNSTNWDAAYSWGNHAGAGYLTGGAIGVTVQGYSSNLTNWAALDTSAKQDALVSGTNIKTINGSSLLGSGDLAVSGGSSTLTIQNKTAAYTVVAGDLGTIINCTSGTFTVSLTAAATLGAGFNVTVWNTSETTADAITIDPAGTETIDGLTTLILRRGEGMQIVCDGTNWQTSDKKVMRGYAENVAAANARPIASGNGSVALGYGASATGDLGAAFGPNATASAVRTLGFHGEATSDNSSAVGYNSAVQRARTVTGSGAMALGGSYASGTDSFAAAVASNSSSYGAKASNAIAIGKQAKATQNSALALGELAAATGAGGYCTAIGYYATASGAGAFSVSTSYSLVPNCIASGTSAIAIGEDVTASQKYACAFGASAASAVIGKYAYSGGMFAASGDSQTGTVVLRRATTTTTSTVLTSDNSSPTSTNQVILPNNSAYAFSGIIVARQSAAQGTASAAWKVEGLIRREANAASTVLVNSALTVIDNTPGWTLALSADTTNGGLAITATGAASTNIRWVATIQTSEVTYA